MADRNEVIKGLECCSDTEPKCKECPFLYADDDGKLTCIGKLLNAAKEVLKEYPEIVRCKDCKYYIKGFMCRNVDAVWKPPKDDDYCSFGERRETQ